MSTIQITLNDQQAAALRSIAQRASKTETEIIVEAVEQFIAQHDQAERNAALQQAKGMWQNRTEPSDLRTLREENSHYSVSTEAAPTPVTSWRYEAEVMDEGRIELQVPLPQGSHIVVYVTEEPAAESFGDLLAAASTSLDFWDNALDDEDWNDA